MVAGAGWEAELTVAAEAVDSEGRPHGIERRAGTDPLTDAGARRRDAHGRRGSRAETRMSGERAQTLAALRDGERMREGAARSGWHCF